MFQPFLRCAVCLSLLTAGCAPTVEVTSNAPTTEATTRTERIAVLNVDGPEKHAAAATQRLVRRLRQSGLYQVVDERALQKAAPESLRDGNGRLRKHVAGEAGRRMRLDALVVTSLRTRDSRKEAQLRFGYPVVSATTMYTWVELPSGKLRDAHQGEHGEQATGGSSDLMAKCVAASVDKLTEKLAPNLQVVTRELAGSKWLGDLSEGNRLAAENKWQAAEAAWNQVVRDDPDNDGAWYNLGIAAEGRGDYPLAHDRYRRAQQIDDRDQYLVALQRVGETLPSRQITSRQTKRLSPTRQRQHVQAHPPQRTTYVSQYPPHHN